MDQARNGLIPHATINQPAGIPASPFTITTLAGRFAQLANTAYTKQNSDQINDEQKALEILMAYLEPMSLDEALTLGEGVVADLDGMASDADLHGEDDVSCSAAKMRRLAKTMKAICCGLKRHGAKSLLMPEQVD